MPASREKQALTKELRRRIHGLRAQNLSWDEVGREVGVSANTAEAHYRRAVSFDGLPKLEARIPRANNAVAREDPQAVGNVLGALMVADASDDSRNVPDKFKALHAAAAECGLRPAVVKAMIKRLSTSLAPVAAEGKRLTVAELTAEIEKKTTMVLGYMDDYSMAQASFKDLGIGLSVLIEKHQLLNNKPTMIVDVNTREKLPVLVNSMLAEARRRGITVEGSATVVGDGPG